MWTRVALAMVLAIGAARPVRAQEPASGAGTPPPSAAGDTSFVVQNLTRAELWRFFEPRAGGGRHPDYVFAGNRSTLGARYRGSRWGVQGAIQYVRLENLPIGAVGPGLFGTGGHYFFQAGGTFSYQFYLRSLSVSASARRGAVWAEVGRWSRAIDRPQSAQDCDLGEVVGAQLDERLLGDMGWSMYQRAWDGVRAGVERPGWRATVTVAAPTQGTFEESANLTIDRLHVGAVEVHGRTGALVPRTAVDVFGYWYDDRRRITARPDNSVAAAAGATAPAADVQIATVGVAAVTRSPSAWGRWDTAVWGAVQRGDWYGQPHRAWSSTVQAGHQWSEWPWRPWLRVGADYASGDTGRADGTHGTFFPMLPSGNEFARSNVYALMNVVDAWAELRTSPRPAVDAYAAVHRVGLASGADRWYSGSGATMRAGNYFGFQGRNTQGARPLGTVFEGQLTWRPTRWWSLRGYAGRMQAGQGVRNVFAGDRLVTAWLESLLSF